jgi:hypothetical protein
MITPDEARFRLFLQHIVWPYGSPDHVIIVTERLASVGIRSFENLFAHFHATGQPWADIESGHEPARVHQGDMTIKSMLRDLSSKVAQLQLAQIGTVTSVTGLPRPDLQDIPLFADYTQTPVLHWYEYLAQAEPELLSDSRQEVELFKVIRKAIKHARDALKSLIETCDEPESVAMTVHQATALALYSAMAIPGSPLKAFFVDLNAACRKRSEQLALYQPYMALLDQAIRNLPSKIVQDTLLYRGLNKQPDLLRFVPGREVQFTSACSTTTKLEVAEFFAHSFDGHIPPEDFHPTIFEMRSTGQHGGYIGSFTMCPGEREGIFSFCTKWRVTEVAHGPFDPAVFPNRVCARTWIVLEQCYSSPLFPANTEALHTATSPTLEDVARKFLAHHPDLRPPAGSADDKILLWMEFLHQWLCVRPSSCQHFINATDHHYRQLTADRADTRSLLWDPDARRLIDEGVMPTDRHFVLALETALMAALAELCNLDMAIFQPHGERVRNGLDRLVTRREFIKLDPEEVGGAAKMHEHEPIYTLRDWEQRTHGDTVQGRQEVLRAAGFTEYEIRLLVSNEPVEVLAKEHFSQRGTLFRRFLNGRWWLAIRLGNGRVVINEMANLAMDTMQNTFNVWRGLAGAVYTFDDPFIYGASRSMSVTIQTSDVVIASTLAAASVGLSVYQWWRGDFTGRQLGKEIVATITTAAVSFAASAVGFAAGAAVGSALGPVGTIIGGILGAFLGSLFVGSAAHCATRAAMDHFFPDGDKEVINAQRLCFTQALRVLDCSPSDTFLEIKANFRLLARQHHPDRGGSAENFMRVQLAYEIVTQYKRVLEEDLQLLGFAVPLSDPPTLELVEEQWKELLPTLKEPRTKEEIQEYKMAHFRLASHTDPRLNQRKNWLRSFLQPDPDLSLAPFTSPTKQRKPRPIEH